MNNGYILDTTYDTPTKEPRTAYDMTMYNKVLNHFVSLLPEKVVARIFGEREEHVLDTTVIKEFLSTPKATMYNGWTLRALIPNMIGWMEMACFPSEEIINVVFFSEDGRKVRCCCVEVLQCHGSVKDYPVFCHDLKTNKQCVYRDVAWAFDPNRTVGWEDC